MDLFQTGNREETARALAARYDRVMIRNKNLCWNPLRMRRSEIADLKPYIVMSPTAFDAQLQAWNRDGGVLVHERNYVSYENVGAHHAQLISEAPPSLDMLERYTEGARELAVVFRSPRWDEHRRWVVNTHPTGDACGRLYQLVRAAPRDDAMARLLEIPEGFHVLRDDDARKALDVRQPVLNAMRRTLFRKRSIKTLWGAALRAEPEDRPLAEVYQYIARHCPVVDGAHLVLGTILMRKVRFWKRAMRQLERCGAIGTKGLATIYWPEELPPNLVRLDARRRRAERQLDEVIAMVEALPEFTPAKRRPRSPARTKAQSACA